MSNQPVPEARTPDEQAIRFCRSFDPTLSDDECLDAYDVYLSYRSEGQSAEVSRQYAGLC